MEKRFVITAVVIMRSSKVWLCVYINTASWRERYMIINLQLSMIIITIHKSWLSWLGYSSAYFISISIINIHVYHPYQYIYHPYQCNISNVSHHMYQPYHIQYLNQYQHIMWHITIQIYWFTCQHWLIKYRKSPTHWLSNTDTKKPVKQLIIYLLSEALSVHKLFT